MKKRIVRLAALTAASTALLLGFAGPAEAQLPGGHTYIHCTSGMDGKTYTCVGRIWGVAVVTCTSGGCVHH